MSMTPEQELALLKMQQQMASQFQVQQQSQGGAITGSGIRAWWVVIAFIITSLAGVGVWLASNSSKATEEFVNIKRDIAELQRIVGSMTKAPNDVFSLPPRVEAVEKRQAKQDEVLAEINKTLAGLPQQFTNLSMDIRNIRNGGR